MLQLAYKLFDCLYEMRMFFSLIREFSSERVIQRLRVGSEELDEYSFSNVLLNRSFIRENQVEELGYPEDPDPHWHLVDVQLQEVCDILALFV